MSNVSALTREQEIAFRACWLLEADVQLGFHRDLERHAENALRKKHPDCDRWPRGQFFCELRAIADRVFAEDVAERFPEEMREAAGDYSDRLPRRSRSPHTPGFPGPDVMDVLYRVEAHMAAMCPTPDEVKAHETRTKRKMPKIGHAVRDWILAGRPLDKTPVLLGAQSSDLARVDADMRRELGERFDRSET